MRADRLLSLVLLLRHRGRMSATELAAELEVSTRTVLRDIDALSAAGIPVYAERGRTGGFALLPGFSTDLTGLTPAEAVALLAARSRGTSDELGMGPAFGSAMRKVVAALPAATRAEASGAAERVLLRSGGMLGDAEPVPALTTVQRAVFAGHRLRLRYGGDWRTIDPLGLVNASGRWYLLALRDGADRTYRISRVEAAEELPEPARRPDGVDLEALWRRRRDDFHATLGTYRVRLRIHHPDALARLRAAALDVEPDQEHDAEPDRAHDGEHADGPDDDAANVGREHARATADEPGAPSVWRARFGDARHAVGVLWQLAPHAELLDPADLRAELSARAHTTAAHYSQN